MPLRVDHRDLPAVAIRRKAQLWLQVVIGGFARIAVRSSYACGTARRLRESRHDRDHPSLRTRYVYDFAEGSRDMRVLLGGKGANIAEMTRVLGADLVPAGFTITTEACVAFMRDGRVEPAGLAEQVADGIARLEERAGRRLGDPDDPLLVSVRSGARDSMPGMLETILDLGLNDASVRRPGRPHGRRALRLGLLPALRADVRQRRPRRARRALRGDPARRAPARRRARGPRALASTQLQDVTRRFRTLYEAHTGEPFPQDPQEQLRLAIRAVFDSWLGDRAVAYRRINHIPDDWGTAVNVQQMVFGNTRRGLGDRRRVLARRGHRRARAERRLPARRAGRGRGLGRAHAAPAARARRRAARARTRSCSRSCARSRRTTATCRTSSSPSSAAACTCSRRAAPSARPRPPCASPSTRSTRVC